ncbi:MAG: AI-2E family transporter [Deltaproteobacteria bacterium]|nr:AI-2E family transporter [Deltaproteobacteria bacterium]
MQEPKRYTFDRVIRIAITAGLLVGLVWLLEYLSDVLIPFAVALLLAYMINPLVTIIQGKIKSRVPAVFLGLFSVIFCLALLVWLIVPPIINEISHMGKVLSAVVNNSDFAARAAQNLPPDIWQTIKDYAAEPEVQDFFKTENFLKVLETVIRKILPGVWGFITGTTSFLTGLVGFAIIGMYLVFLLLDYQKVKQNWRELIPQSHRESVLAYLRDFSLAMNRHFRAQALVAFIDGGLFALGFWLIDLPLGILLGLLGGVLCMVPYLAILILPPAVLMVIFHALETNASILWHICQVLIVFLAVQGFDGAFITPRIMGEVTGLNPAMILLSLSIWGKLLGIFGLLIALPMTCLILAYYRRFLAGATGGPTLPVIEEPPPKVITNGRS